MKYRSIHFVLAWLLLVGNAWAQETSERDRQLARQTVQRALRSEIEGAIEDRQALLQQARQTSSKEPAVRWHSGDVQIGKDWKSYDEVVARAQQSKQLEQYREMRDKSEPTVPSQYELAIYCRKHNLKEQGIAHWSAILELNPEHVEARNELGFVKIEDQWLKTEEVARQRQVASGIASAARKHSDDLRRLSGTLASGKTLHHEAVEVLARQKKDIGVLPLWESIVSTRSSAGALVVVDVLGSMKEPQASLSLARHAVWSPFPEARSAARAALKDRDPNAFVPAMLGELQGPLLGFRQLFSDGGNRLTARYTLVADSKEKIRLKVLDESFFLTGDNGAAAALASRASANTEATQNSIRQRMNLVQDLQNRMIIEALEEITGQRELESPQAWWQWWDNENEIYTTGLKPIDSSYAYREYEVRGALPISLSSGSRTRSDRESEDRKKDCLAGGTPVLTERGPVNIERIRMGDMVLAKHQETGEVRLQPVLRTTIRAPEPLMRITFESDASPGQAEQPIQLRCSGGHPFWVSGKGWQRARLIEPGMRLHGLTSASIVKSIEIEETATPTYNLVVADFHSYFAGRSALLTHDNSMIQPTSCKVPGLSEK